MFINIGKETLEFVLAFFLFCLKDYCLKNILLMDVFVVKTVKQTIVLTTNVSTWLMSNLLVITGEHQLPTDTQIALVFL